MAEVVPKSKPNTSLDFLKLLRSSEVRVDASSEEEARSGTSAPLTLLKTCKKVMSHHPFQSLLWVPEEGQDIE